MNEVEWTRPKLERFRREYNKATENSNDVFTFEGNEFVVGYAKYLIEYLDDRLEKPHV